MSRDNWARLVETVVRREKIREMFLSHSRSPSISTIASSDDDDVHRDDSFNGQITNDMLRSLSVSRSPPSPAVTVTNPSAVSKVSELGTGDSSRNIVEIIFKSSWLKPDNPICKIERILKVHNTQRTIQRFEDYRNSVRLRSAANAKRNARCAADGNELLRFHSVTLACSLCCSTPVCGICTIIRYGFQVDKISGIRTTASSGHAHDCLDGGSDARRAMLVCRVIAGKVKRAAEEEDEGGAAAGGAYDSLATYGGVYSSMEELYVFSSRAILPCFVVIYEVLES